MGHSCDECVRERRVDAGLSHCREGEVGEEEEVSVGCDVHPRHSC
jgi:hypothetical protein